MFVQFCVSIFSTQIKIRLASDKHAGITPFCCFLVVPELSYPRNVRVQRRNPETIVVEWDKPEIQNDIIQVRLSCRRV